MRNEENKVVKENREAKEMNRSIHENKAIKEVSDDPQEFKQTFESQPLEERILGAKRNKRKKANQATAAGTAVVGVASLAVIASSGLINVAMDGQILDLTFEDNGIRYSIDVEDVKEGNSLWFSVYYLGDEVQKYDIVSNVEEDYTGELNGYFSISDLDIKSKLKADEVLSYNFRLCGDTGLVDRTYDAWDLEVSSFESIFYKVRYGCDCKNSGNYHFQMDFKDDYGAFSDFHASITDSDGFKRECVFTDNYHEEQSIPVLDMAGGKALFELYYTTDNGVVKYSYETTI